MTWYRALSGRLVITEKIVCSGYAAIETAQNDNMFWACGSGHCHAAVIISGRGGELNNISQRILVLTEKSTGKGCGGGV
jgi:hypothetical protein